MKLKVKIITGFRDDQYYIIPSEEAHKAYFLFNNPEARTVFSNGVALIGKNIQGIEPAWNETMGWNPTHRLDGDDWNEIRLQGVEKELRYELEDAKKAALMAVNNTKILAMKLSETKNLLLEGKYENNVQPQV